MSERISEEKPQNLDPFQGTIPPALRPARVSLSVGTLSPVALPIPLTTGSIGGRVYFYSSC
ncbi:MAG TPA: hypothetical protein VG272_00300 [Candidatus Acidoferrales bacterium]|nr:hypothetical protein [Candidatus Acidoferrales bacterium]